MFVVRIMRQPHKVAMQFMRPAEQRGRVLLRPGAAAAIGRLGVDVDAAQKDRLAVEQNLVALHLDGAEADIVVKAVVAGFHLNAIKLRMLGRPADQILRRNGELRVAIGVGCGLLRYVQLGNAQRDGRSGARSDDMHIAFDLVAGATPLFISLELKRIIVDVALRHIDEIDLAGESAVVPPVGLERRNGVCAARVIDGDDDEILAV